MAPCTGIEPVGSCVTGRPRHQLRRTVQGRDVASDQLGLVTLFVVSPPRENRNYDAMGSRKLRFQPLTVIIAVRPARLAAVPAMVVLSCICDIYTTSNELGCQMKLYTELYIAIIISVLAGMLFVRIGVEIFLLISHP